MAGQVIDIIHELRFNANTTVLEAINAEFGKEIKQINELQAKIASYEKQLDSLAKDDIANRKIINGLIDQNKKKVDELTVSIGKEFAANQKLSSTVVDATGKLRNLSFAGSQLLREAPAFAFSIQTGILALSNNIPILLDQLKAARESGASTGQIFKSLGQSIFSLTGLLTIGVTVLTLFADKIFSSGKNANKSKDDLEKYADSLKKIEDQARKSAFEEEARLKVLVAAATDQALATNKRKQAVDELQALYPSYLGNIKDEAILSGEAAGAINEITKALFARAAAEAAQKKLVEASERIYDLTLKQRRATEELTKAQKELNNQGVAAPTQFGGGADAGAGALDREIIARNRLQQTTEELAKAEKDRLEFFADIQANAKAAGDLFLGDKKPTVLTSKDKADKPVILLPDADGMKALHDHIEGLRKLDEVYRQLDKTTTEMRERQSGLTDFEEFNNQVNPNNPILPEREAQALNAQLELRQSLKAKEEAEDKERQVRHNKQMERIAEESQAYANVANAAIRVFQAIFNQQQELLDREIEVRQRRVDEALLIAERGNTEALRLEQERLNESYRQKEQIARKEAQLNSALAFSNALVAATGAIATAAKTGDPYTVAARIAAAVAAVIAALGTGYAFVKSFDTSPNFAEGGYTGDGGKYDPAGTVHKGEYVITKEKTQEYRPLLDAIHYGLPITKSLPQQGFASKKELDGLRSEMKNVVSAIDGLSFRAENKMDGAGVHQLIETQQRIQRNKWS